MAETSRIERLAQKVRQGDPMALGRALTIAENGGEEGKALLRLLEADTGKARIIGFTGPPGAGKSTLVDALIREWRKTGQPVAVLAIDPVSPVSGGAVLGDRTRMGAHSLDDGVFIRSVSARGHLGGLCLAAHDMADVMDAAGWPLILIETVGAGQSETEITQVADLSVVISAPGLGDELQAIKAGILEIADVLVVNKADRPEAEQTAKHLEAMLALRASDRQDIPVLRVAASTGAGVDDLRAVLDSRVTQARADRRAKRNSRRLALAALELASRISAGIPEDGLAELDQTDIERVLRQSLATLTAETET
ncbi:methylmalonyl Co-A mutase-associated GTPase MeaB [Mameliella alba]|nr:methylmalonyl Co-A mutase-associated GTPase MeaB [Mameliella alba]MBY6172265.1 methylmalonyl Co-A mutase-associated GTPase MeaB [Mameliella alba]MBY6177341.1 methylmalonyl Co-A mutase-associated GTPase MeaB [Mameliella alba]